MPVPIHDDNLSSPETEPRSMASKIAEQSFPALEHFRIKDIPPAAYYIPEFITPEEEEYLTRKIKASPQPKWKTVGTGRRLQYWAQGVLILPGGNLSKNGVLLPEPLPDFLTSFPDIIERIESFLDIASGKPKSDRSTLGINQVLVNEYQSHHSISPHQDGPAFHPLVATISLNSHTILDLYHYISPTTPSPPMTSSISINESNKSENNNEEGRTIAAVPLSHILLMPRSLFILSSSLYTSHLHGIQGRPIDNLQNLSPLSTQTQSLIEINEIDNSRSNIQKIANTNLIGDADIIDAIQDGSWNAERNERLSLTFRHANKVIKGGGALGLTQALRR